MKGQLLCPIDELRTNTREKSECPTAHADEGARMGGGRPIAECRNVPAPFVAGQPDTLMQGFMTKQTKNRNWRQRYAILTPRLSLLTHTPPLHNHTEQALTCFWGWWGPVGRAQRRCTSTPGAPGTTRRAWCR